MPISALGIPKPAEKLEEKSKRPTAFTNLFKKSTTTNPVAEPEVKEGKKRKRDKSDKGIFCL